MLRKVEVDKTDGYDQQIFGLVLVGLNLSGIAMIFVSQAVKPAHYLMDALFAEEHSHDGDLRGMNEETTRNKQGFVQHFVRVAGSTTDEAGWKFYSKPTEEWKR